MSRWNTETWIRVLWAVGSSIIVESLIFGFSVLPAALFWQWNFTWKLPWPWLRTVFLSMTFIPSYMLFAVSLIILSGITTRLLGWRTPENVEMRIDDPSWPLLNWIRYMVSVHLVRIFAGMVFRATPLWTLYLRLNGAKFGHRVYVNSLAVTDHNLLEFGDDVVIGSEVHLSGHTVEQGCVKTARVRLGNGVTIGTGSVIGIGVEAGPGCQIGALSLVQKFRKLDGHRTYAGIPVQPIESALTSASDFLNHSI